MSHELLKCEVQCKPIHANESVVSAPLFSIGEGRNMRHMQLCFTDSVFPICNLPFEVIFRIEGSQVACGGHLNSLPSIPNTTYIWGGPMGLTQTTTHELITVLHF